MNSATLDQLTQACTSPDLGVSEQALQCLTQFGYSRARPLLQALWPAEPLRVAKLIYWHAKEHAEDWVSEISSVFTTPNPDPELFRFAAYLAQTCTTGLTALIQPFVMHPNPVLSKQAAYIVQKIAESRPSIWQRIRGITN